MSAMMEMMRPSADKANAIIEIVFIVFKYIISVFKRFGRLTVYFTYYAKA